MSLFLLTCHFISHSFLVFSLPVCSSCLPPFPPAVTLLCSFTTCWHAASFPHLSYFLTCPLSSSLPRSYFVLCHLTFFTSSFLFFHFLSSHEIPSASHDLFAPPLTTPFPPPSLQQPLLFVLFYYCTPILLLFVTSFCSSTWNPPLLHPLHLIALLLLLALTLFRVPSSPLTLPAPPPHLPCPQCQYNHPAETLFDLQRVRSLYTDLHLYVDFYCKYIARSSFHSFTRKVDRRMYSALLP